MRYLAIDYGGKRTGLALCDRDETLASPVVVIENPAQCIPKILEVVKNEQVETIVLGLPLNMDDSEGPTARAVRTFAKDLAERIDIPIIFHDERLSSFEAEQKFVGAGLTRKKKKKRLDAVAAAAILQSFLDKKHGSSTSTLKSNLVIVDDYESLSRKALEFFVAAAQDAIGDTGVFYAAISGGTTPRRFFELLGQSPDSLGLLWEKIHLFWTDERCVSPDSEQSNYKRAADTFLSRVDIPAGNVHRIAGELADAQAYEKTIREVFGIGQAAVPVFDLILLGMGADGHTASLFPYSPALAEVELCAVATDSAGKGPCRITLTVPVLCAASRLLVMVSGQDKAETLRLVLNGEPDQIRYPIRSLWPAIDRTTWLIDAAAARLLK
ncbi:MAG: 6-phosphogluconolactonase [Sedimentisphaerales bacterium]|nr:6-phosphogluconolactonase [Sedimentisphaerales bacterium]